MKTDISAFRGAVSGAGDGEQSLGTWGNTRKMELTSSYISTGISSQKANPYVCQWVLVGRGRMLRQAKAENMGEKRVVRHQPCAGKVLGDLLHLPIRWSALQSLATTRMSS